MRSILITIGITIFFILFCFYIAIYYLFTETHPDKGSFGTFGDTVGGVANPILAFISFIAILYTIYLSYNNQKIISFDTTFHSLLEQHNKILNDIKLVVAETNICKLDLTFNAIIDSPKISDARYHLIYSDTITDNYFRIVYQILNHIDKNHPQKYQFEEGFNLHQKNYSNILRSIIDQKTLFLIAINAASNDSSPTYKRYKQLIERSNFLEHLKYDINFHSLIQEAHKIYDIRAFGESIFLNDYLSKI